MSSEAGKQISKQERKEKNCLTDNNLTYGEINYKSIAQCFTFIKNKYNAFQNPGGVFIDLGHGTGKGVLTACLMHPFEKCFGIELLTQLYDKSLDLKKDYEKYI